MVYSKFRKKILQVFPEDEDEEGDSQLAEPEEEEGAGEAGGGEEER